jgi:hypothetical protein
MVRSDSLDLALAFMHIAVEFQLPVLHQIYEFLIPYDDARFAFHASAILAYPLPPGAYV